jgi:raffinose/stachyose/melibiose transport system permease protein
MEANARTRLLFMGPGAVVFAVLMLVPLLATLGLAFASWTGFDINQIRWVGTANFSQLLHDPIIGKALKNTVLYVVALTVFINIFGLGMALLINTHVRGSNLLRIAMFVPLGLSPVITGILWQYLLGPYGLVNQLLTQTLGILDSPIGFLGDKNLAFFTIVAASLWAYNGVIMLIYYAALQTLPRERMEAASIDGAGRWRRLRWVTIPHLRPAIAVAVVLSLITGWKVFDFVLVLTNGGPDNATEVLGTDLYRQAFQFSNVGYASLIALLITVLAVLSTLLRGPIAGEQYT